MFCSKCGTKLEDGSLFCGSCGNNLNATNSTNGSTTTFTIPSIQSDKIKSVFGKLFTLIKNPVSYSLIAKETLSFKSSLLTVIISLLLIPVITILTLKSVIMNSYLSLFQMASTFKGRPISPNEIAEFKMEFGSVFDAIAPTSQVFIVNILFYGLLFGLITVSMILFFRILKIDFSAKDVVYILILPSLMALCFSAFSILSVSISIKLSLFINLLATALITITFYNGFKSFSLDSENIVYYYACTGVLSVMLTYYFCFKFIISELLSTIFGSGFIHSIL